MCYTGKCPYENYQGDCTRPWGGVGSPLPVYPDDARCVVVEMAQELDFAGLLGDIDIDDTSAITTAYKEYVEQGQEVAALEEALGELVDFEPGMTTKGLRSAIDALKEDACKPA